ncbi:hypothetical protein AKJ16_DCAP02932 [Drosera capensis]
MGLRGSGECRAVLVNIVCFTCCQNSFTGVDTSYLGRESKPTSENQNEEATEVCTETYDGSSPGVINRPPIVDDAADKFLLGCCSRLVDWWLPHEAASADLRDHQILS